MLKDIANQPRDLWLLLFGKIWDTFSFFGTQTILVLYYVHVFHFSSDTSYLIYGTYSALAFSTPILGGILADRYIGSRKALVLGGLLNVMGNLLLIVGWRYLFSLGLAMSLVGSGLYKSNVTQLVGTLYPSNSSAKETGYTWLYLASNVGGTLAPLIYGVIIYLFGWNWGFLCNAIGISLGLLLYLTQWRTPLECSRKQHDLPHYSIYPLILVAIGLLSLPFYWTQLIDPIVLLIFICSISYLTVIIYQHQGSASRQLLAIVIISIGGMFYYAAGLQIGSTITLFITHKIQQGVLHTILPASAFSSLYCFFVILLAPFFTWLWSKLKARGINPSAPLKVTLGIFLATLGISTFMIATLTSFVVPSIIGGNLLLSAGEVVITPTIYTLISDVAPQPLKSTMMGCWFLFVAWGGYISGLLARFSHTFSTALHLTGTDYLGEFIFIAAFTLCITLTYLMLSKQLKQMLLPNL